MTVLDPAEYRALLRNDFHSFLVRSFYELYGGEPYSPAWHVEALAAKLAEARARRALRLVVNIPPRHLKSLAASVALPAWLLGNDPALGIVNVTYGRELSDKFARDCRALMTAPWYRALFPARLASARPPFRELATTGGGFRLATSVGGVLTGRGADVILIDDPLKPADAMSQRRRAAANEWFEFDFVLAPQRQGQRRDRHRHAAPARRRSRRPRPETARLGARVLSRYRRTGRAVSKSAPRPDRPPFAARRARF